MDRLTSLTVFGQVVDLGGFSAAARRLNMSVTMVSNHIQSLEERLGVRLLNRTTRKVSLTETGRAYYERSTQILADLDEADNIASALHSTPRGTLRLHSSAAMIRFLSPVVDEYMALYPQVSINLEIGERMVNLVEEGFDLVIRTVPLPDSSLIVRRLTPWRHVVCCAPSYLQKQAAPLKPEDLADHNCLRYAFYPYGDDWRFEDVAGQIVSGHVGGNVVTTSAEMLRHLALEGRGLFLAPSFVVVQDLAVGRLIRLMPDYQPVEFSINAIYPSRHMVSAKVRGFIEMLANRFAEHRRWMTGEVGYSEVSTAPI